MVSVTSNHIPLFLKFLRIQRIDESRDTRSAEQLSFPISHRTAENVYVNLSMTNLEYFDLSKTKFSRNLELTVRRKTFTWIEACANSCGNTVTDFFFADRNHLSAFLFFRHFIFETSENKRCRISHSCIATEEMAESAWTASSYLSILPKRQVNETRIPLLFCGQTKSKIISWCVGDRKVTCGTKTVKIRIMN